MLRDERGSTLITVLAAVVILTVMMTGLLGVSNRSISETVQYDNGTKALTNARSGILAVYNQMQAQWKVDSPTGGFGDATSARNALKALATQVGSSPIWNDAPFSVQVASTQPQQTSSSNNVSSLSENYIVDVTSTEGQVAKHLQATFNISGIIDALNYALYTPGNLFICGAPVIDGKVSAGGSIYFDSTSWEGTVKGKGDSSSYLTYEGQNLEFNREPPGAELDVLPAFGVGSTIASQMGLYSFSSFSDQNGNGNGTYQFGNASSVKDGKVISTQLADQNSLNHFVTGSPIITAPNIVLPSDYVSGIITGNQSTTDPNSILSEAKANGQYGTSQNPWSNASIPQSGGYLELGGPGQTLELSRATFNVGGATYINGDLTIDSNAILNLTQPMFVAGNLTVNGILNSSAAIFVHGSTTITNVPVDVQGKDPSRLELYSLGNIELTLLNNGSNGAATKATTFNAFFASDQSIYLEGMDSYYHINGGISGRNLILNSTVGSVQRLTGNHLKTDDRTNTDPRLVITYDPSYVIRPLVGTPTVHNLTLQPLPQPIYVSP